MKILAAEIENFGPYVGRTRFDLSPEGTIRRIVLLGGKNGAGKTTFFESLRLALYGPKAFGLAVRNAKYGKKVASLVNKRVLREGKARASIAVSLRLEDGNHENGSYRLDRSWEIEGKDVRETLKVSFKPDNGDERLLGREEEQDFEMTLESLLPLSLFPFYFFDGEKLTDFFLDGKGFRETLIAMTGMESLDILVSILGDLAKKEGRAKDAGRRFEKAEKTYLSLKSKCDALRSERDALKEEIEKKEEDFQEFQKEFLRKGGLSAKARRALEKEIEHETEERERKRVELKAFANTHLPILIMERQVWKALEGADSSRSAFLVREIKKAAEERGVLPLLSEQLGPQGLDGLLRSIFGEEALKGEGSSFYRPSPEELSRIREQLEEASSADLEYFSAIEEDIYGSMSMQRGIREKLKGVSEEGEKALEKERKELEKFRFSVLRKIREREDSLEALLPDFLRAEAEYRSALKERDDRLREESAHSLAAKAHLVLAEFERHLFARQVDRLKDSFLSIFSSIINKDGLVDGLEVDSMLRVYPVLSEQVSLGEMVRLREELGESEFEERYGEAALSMTYLESDEEQVRMPLKVSGMSAGERQVYLFALYGALATIADHRMPFLIDFPFGRVDTVHRMGMVDHFFLSLPGQVVILSTDEEVQGALLEEMDPFIARSYTIESKGDGTSRVLEGVYFGKEVPHGKQA